MNKEEARNRLMDYLYDEMSNKEREEFEHVLENDPELRSEWMDLKGTRSLFSHVSHEEPSELLFQAGSVTAGDTHETESPGRANKGARFYPLFRQGLAAAAILLIGVFLTAFAGIEFGKTDQGYYLTMGSHPVPAGQGLTEEEVLNIVTQIREENAIIMATMLDQVQMQQNEQLEEAFNILTAYYEQRRQQDLMLISEGFNQLERDTYSRFRQTDETLGNLIYALSNP